MKIAIIVLVVLASSLFAVVLGQTTFDKSFTTFDPSTVNATFTCVGMSADMNNIYGNTTYNQVTRNSRLGLTNSSQNSNGAVWFKDTFALLPTLSSPDASTGFSTTFGFQIENNYPASNGGADGICFVLQTVSSNAGSKGSGIGYAGITSSVAVEFDTYQNTDLGDINGNHYGMDYNGSLVSQNATSGTSPVNIGTFKDGNLYNVWIDYQYLNRIFELRISKSSSRPTTANLQLTNWNISNYLSTTQAIYGGFTSATGAYSSDHFIKFWSFRNKYNPYGATFTTSIVTSSEMTTSRLTTQRLTTSRLTSSALTTNGLSTSALTTDELTSASMTTNRLTSAPLSTSALTTNPITSAALTTNQITSAPLTTKPLTSAALTTNPLTTAPLTTAALTTAALTTKQLTSAQFTSAGLTTQGITTSALSTSALTTSKLTTNQLTSAQLTSAGLTSAALSTAALTTNEMTTSQLTSASFTSSPLTTQAISTQAISTQAMTTNQITSSQFTSAAFTSAGLTTAGITTAAVSTAAFTSAQLTSSALTTQAISTQAVTSASMTTSPRANPMVSSAQYSQAADSVTFIWNMETSRSVLSQTVGTQFNYSTILQGFGFSFGTYPSAYGVWTDKHTLVVYIQSGVNTLLSGYVNVTATQVYSEDLSLSNPAQTIQILNPATTVTATLAGPTPAGTVGATTPSTSILSVNISSINTVQGMKYAWSADKPVNGLSNYNGTLTSNQTGASTNLTLDLMKFKLLPNTTYTFTCTITNFFLVSGTAVRTFTVNVLSIASATYSNDASSIAVVFNGTTNMANLALNTPTNVANIFSASTVTQLGTGATISFSANNQATIALDLSTANPLPTSSLILNFIAGSVLSMEPSAIDSTNVSPSFPGSLANVAFTVTPVNSMNVSSTASNSNSTITVTQASTAQGLTYKWESSPTMTGFSTTAFANTSYVNFFNLKPHSGTYTINVTVTNFFGKSISQDFTLTVTPLRPSSAVFTTAADGIVISFPSGTNIGNTTGGVSFSSPTLNSLVRFANVGNNFGTNAVGYWNSTSVLTISFDLSSGTAVTPVGSQISFIGSPIASAPNNFPDVGDAPFTLSSPSTTVTGHIDGPSVVAQNTVLGTLTASYDSGFTVQGATYLWSVNPAVPAFTGALLSLRSVNLTALNLVQGTTYNFTATLTNFFGVSNVATIYKTIAVSAFTANATYANDAGSINVHFSSPSNQPVGAVACSSVVSGFNFGAATCQFTTTSDLVITFSAADLSAGFTTPAPGTGSSNLQFASSISSSDGVTTLPSSTVAVAAPAATTVVPTLSGPTGSNQTMNVTVSNTGAGYTLQGFTYVWTLSPQIQDEVTYLANSNGSTINIGNFSFATNVSYTLNVRVTNFFGSFTDRNYTILYTGFSPVVNYDSSVTHIVITFNQNTNLGGKTLNIGFDPLTLMTPNGFSFGTGAMANWTDAKTLVVDVKSDSTATSSSTITFLNNTIFLASGLSRFENLTQSIGNGGVSLFGQLTGPTIAGQLGETVSGLLKATVQSGYTDRYFTYTWSSTPDIANTTGKQNLLSANTSSVNVNSLYLELETSYTFRVVFNNFFGQTYTATLGVILHPLGATASFDQTATKILLSFNNPTNAAGKTVNTTFSCTDVVAPATGISLSGATCKWTPTNQVLEVTLGTFPTAKVGSANITLLPGITSPDGTIQSASGTLAVTAPSLPSFNVTLNGPSTTGYLTTLTTGTLTAQGTTYTWSVSPLVDGVNPFSSATTGTINIEGFNYTAGTTYTFTLTIEDFFGTKKTDNKVVTVTSIPTTAVYNSDGSIITVTFNADGGYVNVSGAAPGSSQFNPYTILDTQGFSFGPATYAIFNTSTSIDIHLDLTNGATTPLNAVLNFHPGVITSIDRNGNPASAPPTVTAAAPSPAPFSATIAANINFAFNNISLNAVPSFVTAQGMTYTWTSTPSNAVFAQGTQMIIVPAFALDGGQTYTAQVTVRNFFGQTDIKTYSVVVTAINYTATFDDSATTITFNFTNGDTNRGGKALSTSFNPTDLLTPNGFTFGTGANANWTSNRILVVNLGSNSTISYNSQITFVNGLIGYPNPGSATNPSGLSKVAPTTTSISPPSLPPYYGHISGPIVGSGLLNLSVDSGLVTGATYTWSVNPPVTGLDLSGTGLTINIAKLGSLTPGVEYTFSIIGTNYFGQAITVSPYKYTPTALTVVTAQYSTDAGSIIFTFSNPTDLAGSTANTPLAVNPAVAKNFNYGSGSTASFNDSQTLIVYLGTPTPSTPNPATVTFSPNVIWTNKLDVTLTNQSMDVQVSSPSTTPSLIGNATTSGATLAVILTSGETKQGMTYTWSVDQTIAGFSSLDNHQKTLNLSTISLTQGTTYNFRVDVQNYFGSTASYNVAIVPSTINASAVYSNDASSITVTFSNHTNQAGISGSSPFTCTNAVVEAVGTTIGSNAQCQWTNDQTLVIIIDFSAATGTTGTSRPQLLKVYAGAVSSGGISSFSIINVNVTDPGVATPLRGSLNPPVAGTAYLQPVFTQGQTVQGMTYNWALDATSTGTLSTSAQNYLSSFHGSSLNLGQLGLSSGTSYSFNVIAINFFGQSTSPAISMNTTFTTSSLSLTSVKYNSGANEIHIVFDHATNLGGAAGTGVANNFTAETLVIPSGYIYGQDSYAYWASTSELVIVLDLDIQHNPSGTPHGAIINFVTQTYNLGATLILSADGTVSISTTTTTVADYVPTQDIDVQINGPTLASGAPAAGIYEADVTVGFTAQGMTYQWITDQPAFVDDYNMDPTLQPLSYLKDLNISQFAIDPTFGPSGLQTNEFNFYVTVVNYWGQTVYQQMVVLTVQDIAWTAILSPDTTSATIFADQDTNQAGYPLNTPFSCSNIIYVYLAGNPICQWTDNRTIVFNFELVQNDPRYNLQNNLFVKVLPVVQALANIEEGANIIETTPTLFTNPVTLPAFDGKMENPTVTFYDKDLYDMNITAGFIPGGKITANVTAGYTFFGMNYNWTVSPELDAFEDQYNQDPSNPIDLTVMPTVNIGGLGMLFGSTYTFTCVITNFFGSQKTVSFTYSPVDLHAAAQYTPDGNHIVISYNRPTNLGGYAVGQRFDATYLLRSYGFNFGSGALSYWNDSQHYIIDVGSDITAQVGSEILYQAESYATTLQLPQGYQALIATPDELSIPNFGNGLFTISAPDNIVPLNATLYGFPEVAAESDTFTIRVNITSGLNKGLSYNWIAVEAPTQLSSPFTSTFVIGQGELFNVPDRNITWQLTLTNLFSQTIYPQGVTYVTSLYGNATWSLDASFVTVELAVSTNLAGKQLHQNFSCSDLFTSVAVTSLSSSVCTWNNASEIIIYPDVNAPWQLASDLTWKAGVYTQPSSGLKNVVTTMTVRSPADSDLPLLQTFIRDAPTSIATTEIKQISVGVPVGITARGMSFQWSVNKRTRVPTTFPNSNTIEINGAEYDAGNTYDFSVTTTNFFGKTDTQTHSIAVTGPVTSAIMTTSKVTSGRAQATSAHLTSASISTTSTSQATGNAATSTGNVATTSTGRTTQSGAVTTSRVSGSVTGLTSTSSDTGNTNGASTSTTQAATGGNSDGQNLGENSGNGKKRSTLIGAIVGGVLGCCCLLWIIIIIVVLVLRKKKKEKEQSKGNGVEMSDVHLS